MHLCKVLVIFLLEGRSSLYLFSHSGVYRRYYVALQRYTISHRVLNNKVQFII